MLVYEPQYRGIGWVDDSGLAPISWFDRDLADTAVGPPFFVDTDTFFSTVLSVTVLATMFIDADTFFTPVVTQVRGEAGQVLKNEVRRIRFLTGPAR